MTLLVKDANTTVQSLATEVDGNGNLVPVHAPAATDAQGVSTPVGPQNPLPVINAAGAAASDGSGTVATGGSAQSLFGGIVPVNGFVVQNNSGAALWISDVGIASADPVSRLPRMVAFSRLPPGTSPPGRSASMARPPVRPLPRAGGDPDAADEMDRPGADGSGADRGRFGRLERVGAIAGQFLHAVYNRHGDAERRRADVLGASVDRRALSKYGRGRHWRRQP
jgi:hypothetical protein